MTSSSSTPEWSSSSRRRSSPIAILRPDGTEERRKMEDSDDEDLIVEGVSALKVAPKNNEETAYVGSVPTRPRGMSARRNAPTLSVSLPGAPLLASTALDEFRENEPPPFSLPENSESGLHVTDPSYGSLRESHLEGKFLDGPSSYRDKASGQIHRLRHDQHVRLDDSATSYNLPTLLPPQNALQKSRNQKGMGDWSKLTPGERMANTSASSNAPRDHSSKPAASSLSSMMVDPPPQAIGTSYVPDERGLERNGEGPDSAVLSTSLTGLEVLLGARQRKDLTLLTVENQGPSSMPIIPPPAAGSYSPVPPVALPAIQSVPERHDGDEDEVFELEME